MALSDNPKDEIYQGIALEVDRRAGNEVPTAPIPKPKVGGAFELNSAVVRGKKCNNFVPLNCPSNAISNPSPGREACERK